MNNQDTYSFISNKLKNNDCLFCDNKLITVFENKELFFRILNKKNVIFAKYFT